MEISETYQHMKISEAYPHMKFSETYQATASVLSSVDPDLLPFAAGAILGLKIITSLDFQIWRRDLPSFGTNTHF